MSCFRVAKTSRECHLIDVGYARGIRGLHVEQARLTDSAQLRATYLRIAREANRRMVAAMRRVRGEA